jgi:hypothetical protein
MFRLKESGFGREGTRVCDAGDGGDKGGGEAQLNEEKKTVYNQK